jgi:hypothetical protein
MNTTSGINKNLVKLATTKVPLSTKNVSKTKYSSNTSNVSSKVKEIKKKGLSLPTNKNIATPSSNLSLTYRELNRSGLKDYKSFDLRSSSRSGNGTARG